MNSMINERRVDCPVCQGATIFDGNKCYYCGGHGYVDQERCMFCNGSGNGECDDTDAIGNFITVPCDCHACEGAGWV